MKKEKTKPQLLTEIEELNSTIKAIDLRQKEKEKTLRETIILLDETKKFLTWHKTLNEHLLEVTKMQANALSKREWIK